MTFLTYIGEYPFYTIYLKFACLQGTTFFYYGVFLTESLSLFLMKKGEYET